MFLINSKERSSNIDHFRHYLLQNFSQDELFEGTNRTNFPAYVELPYPIHPPLLNDKKDIVTQLVEEKFNYNKLLESKRKRYKFDEKIIVKETLANHEYMYLPKHLLEFYQKKDPDVYFSCDYNYYYTGGNLGYLQINSGDYLIRSDGANNLCLNDLREPRVTKKLNYNCPSPIFNINAVKSNSDNLLILRQKHHVNIVKLVDAKKISEVWTDKYKVPLLDAKLNKKKITHLGVIESNLNLSVRDVKVNQTVFNYKNDVKGNCDNFQQFQFFDEHLIALIDRFVVKIIDCRTKAKGQLFDPQLVQCNSLCNFEILGNDLLLASRHYLMKSDLRYLKNVSYFTHSLTSPPCYMDFTTVNDDTFMCLASQNQKNKTLFTGKASYSLPYKVPSIRDTLKECLLRNSDLVLINNLEERLNFSTTGLKVVNLDNDVFIYSSNCLGEVFCQKVSDDPFSTEKPVEALSKWINELENPEPVLYVTNIEEMSRARFALNTNPIEINLTKYKRKTRAGEFLKKFGRRYFKKNVTSNLAKDFLSVWDDDDEEEEVEDLPEVPSVDKVSSWIQTHDFSDEDGSSGFPITRSSQQ